MPHTKPTLPEQYEGQGMHLRLAFGEKWHGCFGHLNVLTLDHDSVITSKGEHDRVVAFLPDAKGELFCRVDHVWKLGTPSPEQVLTVARKDQGVKGKWKLDRVEKWENGKSTDFFFVRA